MKSKRKPRRGDVTTVWRGSRMWYRYWQSANYFIQAGPFPVEKPSHPLWELFDKRTKLARTAATDAKRCIHGNPVSEYCPLCGHPATDAKGGTNADN